MFGRSGKVMVAACAVVASAGLLQQAHGAAVVIENDQSAQVAGWNITAPKNVSLTVTTTGNSIDIEKLANFTEPNQGLAMGFQAISGSTAATSIDFTDEEVQNNTGSAFSQFQFILQNVGSANANFDGLGNVFIPPTGTGVNFTSVSLNSSNDILTYLGTQDAGTTSVWGSAALGDNLLIDAPAGSEFVLKELSQSGSGGGGGGGSVVPIPSAAWQSLLGFSMLGAISIGRRLKRTAV